MTDTTRVHWLRLWTDFPDDYRVNSVSELMQIRLVKLWCLHRRDHLVGAPIEQIAFEIRLSQDETKYTLEVLVGAGLLGEDWAPRGWDKRQRQYDDAAERMAEGRKKRRDEKTLSISSEEEKKKTDQIRSDQTRARRETRSEHVQNIPGELEIGLIVAHLNLRADTHFRPSTEKTRRLIRTRQKEGYKFADFCLVIDNQCQEWLNNPDMVRFLRPETLFGNKFEGYLAGRHRHEVKELTANEQVMQRALERHGQANQSPDSDGGDLREKADGQPDRRLPGSS